MIRYALQMENDGFACFDQESHTEVRVFTVECLSNADMFHNKKDIWTTWNELIGNQDSEWTYYTNFKPKAIWEVEINGKVVHQI